MFRSYLRAWSWTVAVAVCWNAGCTSSGLPGFVKFSADSQRILYDDIKYRRTYLLWTNTGRKLAFDGEVAGVDGQVRPFVLLTNLTKPILRRPISAVLITVADDAVSTTRLPDLPAGTRPRVTFGPEDQTLQASIYLMGSCSISFLAHERGDPNWTATSRPALEAMDVERNLGPPGGASETGYLICHHHDASSTPAQGSGRNVERVDYPGTYEHEFRLRSPNGRFLVKDSDHDDPWRRLTLTDLNTGKKTILLDKDDAGRDLFEGTVKVLMIPLQPLFPKF